MEAFFLNSESEEYLELEISPRGRYILLLLKGARTDKLYNLPLFPDGVALRNPCLDPGTKQLLPSRDHCRKTWTASMVVPKEYMPRYGRITVSTTPREV